MVNPLDVAKSVINVVAGPGAGIVIDAHTQSNQNNARDSSLRKDADDYWKADRQIIENEWGRLDPQYHQPAPNEILAPEAFETWSHEQIWNALNGHGGAKGVEQADINAGADGWRRLTDQATALIEDFRKGVDEDIATLWAGKAANAAMEATRTYSDEFKKLAVGFQMVANGIDLMQGYLDQAKRSVAPPENVNAFGEFMGHIPGNGVLKLSQHRANEAEAHAQDVMSTIYQPGVLQVDGRTPLLPEPYNPVSKPGDQPGLPSGRTPGSDPTSNYPTGTDPQGVDPNGQHPGDPNSTTSQNTGDQNANQPDTNPANTSAPQTVPQNYLEDPVGRPNTPNPSSPHLNTSSPGSPGIPGMPTPGPGKSIPGKPTGPTVPSATGTRAGSPQAGRPGMPGFGMPAAARQGRRRRGAQDARLSRPGPYDRIARRAATRAAAGRSHRRMSENRWQLDGFAFTLAMSAMGRDRLPYPLSYRPEFTEHRDDYERLRARTAQRLQQVFDERLHRALSTLLEPRVRIEIHGFHGPNHTQMVRVHAGLAGQVATIAQQLPGPDLEHGRDVVITQCGANMLAAQIAARLPRCQGGSHYPFTARRSDLDQPVYSRHPTRLSLIEELNRFLRRPRTSTGEITVYPGAAYDARPTDDGHPFIWLDYPTDGRYLLFHHNHNDFSITPGPADELMRQLQSRIDTVNRARSGVW